MKKFTFFFVVALLLGWQLVGGQTTQQLTEHHHAVLLCIDGTVQTAGDNDDDQLGYPTSGPTDLFASVPGLPDIVQIATGRNHTLALDENGKVWAWGSNDHGQLGTGTVGGSILEPVLILQNVFYIAAGRDHSLVIMEDQLTVLAWGYGYDHQLGNSDMLDHPSPTPVANVLDPDDPAATVVQVAASTRHSLALLSNGKVRAWGENTLGQLGDGTGDDSITPVFVSTDEPIGQIECGQDFSLAIPIDVDKPVVGWGLNASGQLGNGTTINQLEPASMGVTTVQDVEAGDDFTIILLNSGVMAACGSNAWGVLGNCDLLPSYSTASLIPVAPELTTLVVDLQIQCTSKYVVAILNDGTVRVWGNNIEGQLGLGPLADIAICEPATPLVPVCKVGDYCELDDPEEVTDELSLECCLKEIDFFVDPSMPFIGDVMDRPAYVVLGNETWTPDANPFTSGNDLFFDVDLVIPVGRTLQINGLNVHFSPRSRVLVQKGGRLGVGSYEGEPTILFWPMRCRLARSAGGRTGRRR